jgi:hypothetical protein
MTPEQRTARIKTLTRELSTLLAQEAPRPAVKFLSAADLPGWVVHCQEFSPCSKALGWPRARWSCCRLDRPIR